MKREDRRVNLWLTVIAAGALAADAGATGRYFAYTYEPETMPAGATEFEQWVTLRSQRNRAVGQKNYTRWELRQELEHGFTDNYTASLYLNSKSESFRDYETDDEHSEFEFEGVSVENRYMVLNPAEHALGLTLYLEPAYSGDEAELEQKIIVGQRHGDWKWAFNLVHATEWELNESETEGEVELDLGVTRNLSPRWSVGLECRNHNELPEYEEWEHSAVFLGPVLTHTQEKWWATLSVLPQVYGEYLGDGDDPDGDSGLVLDEHERINARLIVGIGL